MVHEIWCEYYVDGTHPNGYFLIAYSHLWQRDDFANVTDGSDTTVI